MNPITAIFKKLFDTSCWFFRHSYHELFFIKEVPAHASIARRKIAREKRNCTSIELHQLFRERHSFYNACHTGNYYRKTITYEKKAELRFTY